MSEIDYRVYNNLIDNHAAITAWSTIKSLDIEKLPTISKEKADEFNVIEVFIEVNSLAEFNETQRFDIMNTFETSFFEKINTPSYIFSFDCPLPQSRIRTYKGLLKRKVDKADLIEKEIFVNAEESMFIAMVKANPMSLKLFEQSSNFCWATEKDIFSDAFLQLFYKTVLKEFFYVDLGEILFNHFGDNDLLIRESGDGGDAMLGFQIFCKQSMTPSIISTVELIINQMRSNHP